MPLSYDDSYLRKNSLSIDALKSIDFTVVVVDDESFTLPTSDQKIDNSKIVYIKM